MGRRLQSPRANEQGSRHTASAHTSRGNLAVVRIGYYIHNRNR
jgi:hypothetical protein